MNFTLLLPVFALQEIIMADWQVMYIILAVISFFGFTSFFHRTEDIDGLGYSIFAGFLLAVIFPLALLIFPYGATEDYIEYSRKIKGLKSDVKELEGENIKLLKKLKKEKKVKKK